MPSKWLSWASVALSATAVAAKPNFLVIIADDMDNHMGSVQNMPLLNQYIASQGATRPNHFCTVSLCCPSRASLWTGRHAHNHNVTDVRAPYGGYPKVVQVGVNDNYLPVWLQDAGYANYYAGKLWNGHTASNYDAPYVNGFTDSNFIIGPNAYDYFNTTMVRQGSTPKYHTGQYSTDVVKRSAHGFLKKALAGNKPWFVVAAPVGPHSQVKGGNDDGAGAMPPAPKRHRDLFNGFQIPRTENFNPSSMVGAAYYKNLDLLSDEVIAYNDEWQRHRLRALQSIDEMVEALVKEVSAAGQLDNTYIIFTSDNGYHLSQHRMFAGKNCGLDTDINVPFFIRGPGISAGSSDSTVGSHVDVAPTIMELANLGQRGDFDGGVLSMGGATDSTYSEHITVEHWGRGIVEGSHGAYGTAGSGRDYKNNTFRSVRLIGDGFSFYYSVWCNGEHEFYDMVDDPGQIHNLYHAADRKDSFRFKGRQFSQVVKRLDTLLMVMKSCTGDACRHPYTTLFPNGEVSNLGGSMDKQYDDFFTNQPNVNFEECALGYIKELEGPQDAHSFGGGKAKIRSEDVWKYETGWGLHT